ncbi:neuronal acetylcholine receptor subunit alpha-6-like [Ostrea edulis]|uniref:neuronal acetylcholine receptor subunit alpha-6-like n=1 Tax=Ostrea edulis TaxID=37623 RepID=UPI0024AF350C|nr:neuronal acetylcholine receptor subunit alpha-6-like [Ostrea edulis]
MARLAPSFGHLVFILSLLQVSVVCQTPDNVNSLLTNLFANYNNKIRPVNDQSLPIVLDVSMFLFSVNAVDEVNEKLVTTGFLGLTWTDDLLQWDPTLQNEIFIIFLPQKDIWKPDLVLKNGFKKLTEMGGDFYFLSISNFGDVYWYPYEVFETRCSIDITYFPYDKQTCNVTFIVWSYSADEVIITKSSGGIDFYEYEENSVWTIVSTDSDIKKDSYESEITFTITLQRKPRYYVMNMILPVVCLGLLSLLVFIVPADAGEKMSYSVTVFLAFAVFLTIISAELPVNSESTSILSFYLVLQLMIGALVLIISSIQLRLHYRKSSRGMSKFFVAIVRIDQFLRCVKRYRLCCKKDVTTVENFDKNEEEQSTELEAAIEWSDVTNAIDFLCFWFLLLVNVGLTMFLFLYITGS